MRVAEIGDNCIDVYERIGKKYPTGNVVDTGVNLQKLGIPVSIISTTGNDENGKWMLETLKKEGVDISHQKQYSPIHLLHNRHAHGLFHPYPYKLLLWHHRQFLND